MIQTETHTEARLDYLRDSMQFIPVSRSTSLTGPRKFRSFVTPSKGTCTGPQSALHSILVMQRRDSHRIFCVETASFDGNPPIPLTKAIIDGARSVIHLAGRRCSSSGAANPSRTGAYVHAVRHRSLRTTAWLARVSESVHPGEGDRGIGSAAGTQWLGSHDRAALSPLRYPEQIGPPARLLALAGMSSPVLSQTNFVRRAVPTLSLRALSGTDITATRSMSSFLRQTHCFSNTHLHLKGYKLALGLRTNTHQLRQDDQLQVAKMNAEGVRVLA
jgi:hypothetical protein